MDPLADATDRFERLLRPAVAEAGRQLGRLGERALSDRVRLAVTGLSRAGKTVFIAALVQNLLLARERPELLPFLGAVNEGRLLSVRRLPPRRRATFPFEAAIDALAADPPRWPPSTTGLSELRLSIEYRPGGFGARLLADRTTLTLVIIDYPGEWLLDLPLLERSYEQWSAETIGLARTGPRDRLAGEWLSLIDRLDAAASADGGVVDRMAGLYTDYLQACRREGLSLVQPGRFVMPGDPPPDPGLLKFSPVPGGGPLATEMARRYDLYLRRLVEPFFRDHFRHFDRQIVLIDVLSVLNRGYDVFMDAERALAEVLRCFRYGSSGFLSGLFGARIGKVLFAATKADHITVNQYHNLRLLVEAMATNQGRTEGLAESDTGFGLVASLKSTEGALLRFQGRPVEALRGIPLGQEKEQVLYPGEIPAHHPTQADWAEDRFRFVDFAPRRSGDPRREGLRSIHLDKALEFLIGDPLPMTLPTRPKPGLYPADAAIEPAPPPRLPERIEPPEVTPAARPRRGRVARWFWRAALALVAGLIVLDAALFLDGLFDRSLALGAFFALLIGATAAAGLWWAGSEIRQIRLLDAVDEVRAAAAAALASEGYGKAPPFLGRARRLMAGRPAIRRRFDRLEDMILDTHSDRDIMELFRREVLLPLDAEAYAAVRRAAQWTAVGVSASPVALLDAVLAIWRSLRMVREIAEVYGFRPGPVSTVALARHVLTGTASITAVDVMGDLWAQHLGHRVAGLLSAKLAEGVYAAVRVARLGLLAMQTCRPAPFAPEDEPSLGRLRKEIVGSLTRSLAQPREEGAES